MGHTRTQTAPTTPPPASVDAEAWRRALELAEGNARRLDVRDGGRTVIVLNHPRR